MGGLVGAAVRVQGSDAALPQGAVEGCSMGFTKFCAALLNHPDAELRAIPQTVLEQVPCLFCPLFPPWPVFPHPGASTRLAAEGLWCSQCPPLQSSCRLQTAGFQPHLRWVLFPRGWKR